MNAWRSSTPFLHLLSFNSTLNAIVSSSMYTLLSCSTEAITFLVAIRFSHLSIMRVETTVTRTTGSSYGLVYTLHQSCELTVKAKMQRCFSLISSRHRSRQMLTLSQNHHSNSKLRNKLWNSSAKPTSKPVSSSWRRTIFVGFVMQTSGSLSKGGLSWTLRSLHRSGPKA